MIPPRHTSPRPSRSLTAGFALGALAALLPLAEAHAGDGRLLTTDEAAPIDHFVVGLQRTAVPLVFGIAADTSVLADLALTPNVGLRWATNLGPHHFVLGARYAWFAGASTVSNFVTTQEPAVTKFDPSFKGLSFYGLYGVTIGRVLVQAEVRHSRYETAFTTVTGAVVFNFAGHWGAVGEFGGKLGDTFQPRGAAGIRYAGDNFGVSLGAAYVDLTEPMLPVNSGHIPVVPALDLSWTFR